MIFQLQRDLYLRIHCNEFANQRHHLAAPGDGTRHTEQAAHLLLILIGQLLDIGQRAINLPCFLQHQFADFCQRQAAG